MAAKNHFWQTVAGDFTHALWPILNCFRDKHIFAFYPEIQDGHQKWRENDFWPTVADDSANTLWVKNFIGIALPRTVSKIHTLLHFTQNFKMASENGGKTICGK